LGALFIITPGHFANWTLSHWELNVIAAMLGLAAATSYLLKVVVLTVLGDKTVLFLYTAV